MVEVREGDQNRLKKKDEADAGVVWVRGCPTIVLAKLQEMPESMTHFGLCETILRL